jgi:3,4-dihydroxy 2-butanone 4-phosphate synthase/GTP cyclohydrolase II
MIQLDKIKDAIEDIRQGKIVIVVDDEDREAEGDFICAADLITPELINFMALHGRGLICTALTSERIDQLRLPMMVQNNTSQFETAFTVSVEAKVGTTTGISAQDRSLTSKKLADAQCSAYDFVTPGHTFPLRARTGGVLVRAGHTEAAVDLAQMAGRYPAGVICEIMNPDGTMARLPQLVVIAKELGLKLISIEDLITYRRNHEKLVECVASPEIPTKYGKFKAFTYVDKMSGAEHIALVSGSIMPDKITNVRVHSECLTGDAFGSLRCDCGEQLDFALEYMSINGGVVLYLRQHEGRGIGLANKMRAYELQEQGYDTVDANTHLGFKPDQRSYGIGSQILSDLGVRKMNLLTNNPQKISGLKGFGIEVFETTKVELDAHPENYQYLKTKKEKMGHILSQNLSKE